MSEYLHEHNIDSSTYDRFVTIGRSIQWSLNGIQILLSSYMIWNSTRYGNVIANSNWYLILFNITLFAHWLTGFGGIAVGLIYAGILFAVCACFEQFAGWTDTLESIRKVHSFQISLSAEYFRRVKHISTLFGFIVITSSSPFVDPNGYFILSLHIGTFMLFTLFTYLFYEYRKVFLMVYDKLLTLSKKTSDPTLQKIVIESSRNRIEMLTRVKIFGASVLTLLQIPFIVIQLSFGDVYFAYADENWVTYASLYPAVMGFAGILVSITFTFIPILAHRRLKKKTSQYTRESHLSRQLQQSEKQNAKRQVVEIIKK